MREWGTVDEVNFINGLITNKKTETIKNLRIAYRLRSWIGVGMQVDKYTVMTMLDNYLDKIYPASHPKIHRQWVGRSKAKITNSPSPFEREFGEGE